jgi:hypothetical protein
MLFEVELHDERLLRPTMAATHRWFNDVQFLWFVTQAPLVAIGHSESVSGATPHRLPRRGPRLAKLQTIDPRSSMVVLEDTPKGQILGCMSELGT